MHQFSRRTVFGLVGSLRSAFVVKLPPCCFSFGVAMELYEVMRTTFAARDFVDEPVSDESLARILDNARFAPSGGNRQGWKVIVVRDDATRALG